MAFPLVENAVAIPSAVRRIPTIQRSFVATRVTNGGGIATWTHTATAGVHHQVPTLQRSFVATRIWSGTVPQRGTDWPVWGQGWPRVHQVMG